MRTAATASTAPVQGRGDHAPRHDGGWCNRARWIADKAHARMLEDVAECGPAWSWLTRSLGLPVEVIERHRLGYQPKGQRMAGVYVPPGVVIPWGGVEALSVVRDVHKSRMVYDGGDKPPMVYEAHAGGADVDFLRGELAAIRHAAWCERTRTVIAWPADGRSDWHSEPDTLDVVEESFRG